MTDHDKDPDKDQDNDQDKEATAGAIHETDRRRYNYFSHLRGLGDPANKPG